MTVRGVPLHEAAAAVRSALAGLGTVGGGVVLKMLRDNAELIVAARAGRPISIVTTVSARDASKAIVDSISDPGCIGMRIAVGAGVADPATSTWWWS